MSDVVEDLMDVTQRTAAAMQDAVDATGHGLVALDDLTGAMKASSAADLTEGFGFPERAAEYDDAALELADRGAAQADAADDALLQMGADILGLGGDE